MSRDRTTAFVPAIGLEVHVQLRTAAKMFCACAATFGDPPNTNVCPVCLGYPGALPVMNGEAIRFAAMAGLMLGARVNRVCKFDRKSYFYPDMPKNYQISQYDRPLCEGGRVEIVLETGVRPVRIRRIHLEEDVAKNTHFAADSGVDFNRAGVPLMEVVTEPDLNSPEEALAFLQALKQIILYAGVSGCNLEEGNLRCDVNCSLRRAAGGELGTKTEIKNLNTFKGVYAALKYEVSRQIRVLAAGETVVQETRRWDGDAGVTASMRSKEEAHDYRYFPDPDLMPVRLPAARVNAWRRELPEPPQVRRARFARQYGLPDYDAGVLTADRRLADFFEATVKCGARAKSASNWLMTEMLRRLGEQGREIDAARISPTALAKLANLVDNGRVSSTSAKEVFGIVFDGGGDPEAVVRERGLAMVGDAAELAALVDRVVAENPGPVADYRGGKRAAIQFLMGRVMRLSRGKAASETALNLLRERLGTGLPAGESPVPEPET